MRKFTLFIALVFVVAFTQAQIKRSISVQKAPSELSSSEVVKAQTAEQSDRGVFWSEYFTDGVLPSGWQNVDNSGNNYVWICTNQPPGGTYSDNIPVISSNSGGHFMQLRGDFYNTPMPNPTNEMDAYFQTSPINCSERDGVVILFNQYFRYYGLETSVTWQLQVSNDNTNWVSYDLKEGLAGNASSANPVKMEFNISSVAANEPTVYLRWYVAGTSHYFWMVDDIELSEPPVNDIQLAKIYPEFYGIGFYSKIPTTQVQDFYFSAAVSNFGTAAQHNVRLNGVASDFSSNVYFNDSSVATDTIESEAVDTFGIDAPFTLPAEIRSYEATFSILQDEVEDVPGNNVDQVWFDVTDSIYARDIEITTRTGPSSYTDGVDGDKVGVVYYFPNNEEINSITAFISSYSTAGTSFIGKLLVDDGAGNLIEKATTDIYTLAESDLGTWITVPIIKDGSSEIIEAGTDGLIVYAMLEFYFEGLGEIYVGADQTIHHNFEDESLLMLGTDNFWISMVPAIRLNVNVQGAELTSSIISRENTSCNGIADGEAIVYATGGTLPYTYLWSNGATNDTITSLVAGTYYVTISDNVGATTLDTVIIEQPEVLAITAVITDEGGYQASDGEINITTSGGTYPYSYVWNTGSYSDDIENLGGGTYIVTITDANDCVAIGTYEVAASICGMTTEIIGTNVTCYGGSNGAIDLNVANGLTPYSYSWLSGETIEDLNNLSPDYYSVTVTDAEGCIAYADITIGQASLIVPSSTVSNVLCNGGSDG
ncbi:MAG TPA: hypothetical protein DDX39_06740, partial [Bacteroidales bacterium]|nr:hypothetical protein [Bacteroidales bacterium]